ncbi:unnamed protein product [Arabis nemorensis]|uniref:Uncharacterized protein n=1 Tax=Arabis nemorensis TaxID=586526 RepID=A0A565BHU0_9BRAS|nr:unnamed protein product [Arabis nemorensis]
MTVFSGEVYVPPEDTELEDQPEDTRTTRKATAKEVKAEKEDGAEKEVGAEKGDGAVEADGAKKTVGTKKKNTRVARKTNNKKTKNR